MSLYSYSDYTLHGKTLRLTYIVIVIQLIPPTWVESGHNFVGEQAIQGDQDSNKSYGPYISEKEW